MAEIKRKNALGRGLGAILEGNLDSNIEIKAPVLLSTNEIPLENIEVNPFQPRDFFDQEKLRELADSIQIHGLIQPITVRQLSADKYQIISGERRFQASKLAGLTAIPAYVRTANEQGMLEMALIENIQRENLNPIEIGLSFQRMMSECGLKQEELGDRVGKNRATVANFVRLLKLPPDIQACIRDGQISMGHAKAILSLDKIDEQLQALSKATINHFSVRQLEEWVRDFQNKDSNPKEKKAEKQEDVEITSVKSKLSTYFGTRINIKADERYKGEISIPFVSKDDLNRILEILNA